jgi:hypothetical protein
MYTNKYPFCLFCSVSLFCFVFSLFFHLFGSSCSSNRVESSVLIDRHSSVFCFDAGVVYLPVFVPLMFVLPPYLASSFFDKKVLLAHSRRTESHQLSQPNRESNWVTRLRVVLHESVAGSHQLQRCLRRLRCRV